MSGSLRLDVGRRDAAWRAVGVLLAVQVKVLVDHLGPHVQVDVVLAVDAAPVADLQVDGARDHVARGQVLDRGRVAFHEALALAVDQHAAFAAHPLGDQNAHLVDAGRVELEELHVLQRDAAPQGNRRRRRR